MFSKIAFEKYGSGKEVIVLIHAFPLDGRMWMQQIIQLKDFFTILVPDIRAFGKSTEKETVYATMDTYADDILEVLNTVETDKVILCGLSIGGYIIFRCLQKFPEKIAKIILADTRAENDDNKGLINRANTITKLQEGKKNEVMDGLLTRLLCKNTHESQPEIVREVKAMMEQQTVQAMISASAALAMRINAVEMLGDINIPALIIVGEEDELTPVSFSQTMHQKIKGSQLAVIKNAGHLSNMENPAQFNAALSAFLKS